MQATTTGGFCKTYVYIIMDIFYVIFAILYMIGDSDHYNIIVLRCAKPIPVWIMIAELATVRNYHKNIKSLMLALLFGSIGDILLELQSISFAFFAAGALSFLVGHMIYVISFLEITEDMAEGEVEMREILRYKPLFIIIWVLFFVFSFWSIGSMMRDLDNGSIMEYVLPVYGTFLVLLVMGGLFIFFMTYKVKLAIKAGICFLIGAAVFYSSDNFLAHGKFDNAYKNQVSTSANAYIIMITYYVAQFLMGKGGLAVAEYFEVNQKSPE